MPELSRTFRVAQTVERTSGYVSDLRTSAEWDPHTRSARQLDEGPVAVGTRYEITRHLLGLDADLQCEIVEFVAGEQVHFRCSNAMMQTDEQMRFRADGDDHTEITWTVSVELLGPARHGQAVVPTVLRTIADDGTAALRARVEALG